MQRDIKVAVSYTSNGRTIVCSMLKHST